MVRSAPAGPPSGPTFGLRTYDNGPPYEARCSPTTAQSPAAINPASTRGGDSGSSVKRTPVASRMALATAASGGTIGTSPTPRTP